jgi:hypothetical protein
VLPDQQVPEPLVPQAQQVLQEQQAQQVLREQQAQEPLVQQELRDQQVLQAQVVPMVQTGLLPLHRSMFKGSS